MQHEVEVFTTNEERERALNDFLSKRNFKIVPV
jgi:hypothetical protein